MEVITLVLGLLLSNLSASTTPETQGAQSAQQQTSADFIIYEETHP